MAADGAPLDPRIHAVREDLAADALRGRVDAPRFAKGRAARVTAPVVDVTGRPDPGAPLTTQLLFGEPFTVYEEDPGTGFAWGQCGTDGYVGYVPATGLGDPGSEPTHQITSLGAQLYAVAELKAPPVGWLPQFARFAQRSAMTTHVEVAPGRFVPGPLVAPIAPLLDDYVAAAERLIGVPYLWGGRSNIGLDCSALVQLALMAVGRDFPRDSDMQEKTGFHVEGALRRGDLVFWNGHVGIMRDEVRMLHANAFHMQVATEPLEDAARRIEAREGKSITSFRRL